MAKKTAPAGPRLVKTALRIDFVEGLKPWIELREVLRAAGGKPDAEVQAGPMVLEDPKKKTRVILQVRGLIIEDEAPADLLTSYRNIIGMASKINNASAFPSTSLVRFDSIQIHAHPSSFATLLDILTSALLRQNPITTGATDVALIFDKRENGTLYHTQIGPMEPDQLQREFLKWELKSSPDVFTFIGLDFEEHTDMAFDLERLKSLSQKAVTWQQAQRELVQRMIDRQEES